ncbi:MAG TPA: YifB family Mg chelatase-like AAA ATPase [Solirubrobacteraceae bacterium]|jgi:magnesium chelatase family protein|nr:YifB family Mg chelatase-like AAA ATPase [Solirubrobacteraceae bacterium]
MLARAHTFTIDGLQTRHVAVEVDVRRGLPSFTIVGLADAAVREARERVRAAILNSGFEFPTKRITANLAPGDVPKAGAALDLALACAVLAASDQLPCNRLDSHALFGELALDGSVRACRGTLAVAQAALKAGLSTLVLAGQRACEAQLVDGLDIAVAERLQSAARVLGGGPADSLPRSPMARAQRGRAEPSPDLKDVRGQDLAVRTLVIAAAGGHNCLLSGAPGTGKTMLAQRLGSILPPLSRSEAIEVTRIHSIAGADSTAVVSRRPLRAPHHSVTTAGLIGGAGSGRVGEVVLAHNGVLFLDEVSEFSRAALEALRQPLEDGRVSIVRAQRSAIYPARFMLLAATNPCPCGFAGVAELCRCGQAELARHRRRLSGPLLDRIDLLAQFEHHAAHDPNAPASISSSIARTQVLAARKRQAARLREECVSVNALMDARMLRRHARLPAEGERMMRAARERGMLSARGQHRVLRVARTIADLDSSERIKSRHLGEAIALRGDAGLGGVRST